MRISQFFISTSREAPAEAELVSHRLMLRAGLIRKLGAGLYTWMPLGLRVLRKVEHIVRAEMNRAGAVELFMPAVQPAELWQETGRWQQFGPLMLKIKDRYERDFCFGPTHEEVISDIARREIRSYRQLPINFYQIQTKFRDEIRPRFGVMRAREFMMKDAYSFDVDRAGLEKSYRAMFDAYTRVFTRLGLKFRTVEADSGAIGGSRSQEFHVLADSGEDAIAFCPTSDYAANVELAEALSPRAPRAEATQPMSKVATPGKKTCEEVAALLGIDITKTVKAIFVLSGENAAMMLVRGDHTLNEIKASKIDGFAGLTLAREDQIKALIAAPAGYMGPVGIDRSKVQVIADRTVAAMSDFVCGANEADYHLSGVNWDRDLAQPDAIADIRNVVEGDPSPDGNGVLSIARGIEVGHLFQLGVKYSAAMDVSFLDDKGNRQLCQMGCYGIGVSRIVAAAIEQNHDQRGIIWPMALAPFHIAIIPIGYGRNAQVKQAADRLHEELSAEGFEVLLDDRDERPGVLLADQELIGIPHRIVIGDRGLKQGSVEYLHRRDTQVHSLELQNLVSELKSKLAKT